MTQLRLFASLSLLTVILAACASGTATVSPAQPVEPNVTVQVPVATLDSSGQPAAVPTEALDPTAIPLATSRGPELEASDPATVSLASGGIQLVEFFRFT